MNELVSIVEAAKILGVKISKVRSLILKKEICYIKVGNLIRFKVEDLEKYVGRNTIEATRPGPVQRRRMQSSNISDINSENHVNDPKSILNVQDHLFSESELFDSEKNGESYV